jgi:dihydroflavonol-4-reductase
MAIDVITGATGHLGNVLARALRARGAVVRALVQPGDDVTPLAGLGVELVEADVRQPESLRRALHAAERVFHLAGVVSITTGQEARLEAVNVGGTLNVIAACRVARVGRLVYMSSVHALTEPSGGVLDERAGFDPARAVGPYARSKALASRAVQGAAQRGELDAVLVLPTGVLGPFDFRTSEMGQVLYDLEAGHVPFLLPGAHDWVDVRDVAWGTLAAAERGRTGEAYLLGGERLSMEALATLVSLETRCRVPRVVPLWQARALAALAPLYERLTGRRALLTPYALHALTAPFSVSHEKASRELAFLPRPIARTVRDALEWHRARGAPERRVGPGRLQPRRA